MVVGSSRIAGKDGDEEFTLADGYIGSNVVADDMCRSPPGRYRLRSCGGPPAGSLPSRGRPPPQSPRPHPALRLSSPAVLVPPPLRAGDAVRVIAPSSPFDPEQLERGLAVLSSLGLRPHARADLAARSGYLAGDDARRVDEWREAVADPEATAIFCARGGYGASRFLPAIDPA